LITTGVDLIIDIIVAIIIIASFLGFYWFVWRNNNLNNMVKDEGEFVGEDLGYLEEDLESLEDDYDDEFDDDEYIEELEETEDNKNNVNIHYK
jgi:hypothetical protein